MPNFSPKKTYVVWKHCFYVEMKRRSFFPCQVLLLAKENDHMKYLASTWAHTDRGEMETMKYFANSQQHLRA